VFLLAPYCYTYEHLHFEDCRQNATNIGNDGYHLQPILQNSIGAFSQDFLSPLKQAGRFETFLKFPKLITEDKFPLDNGQQNLFWILEDHKPLYMLHLARSVLGFLDQT
jgi:hypothetical protein